MKPEKTELESIKALEAKAIKLWEKVTNQSINSTGYSFSVGGSSFDLYEANNRLNKALELDESGVSTLMIFRHLYDAFITHNGFTMREFIESPYKIREELDDVLDLNKCLHNEIASPYLDGFISTLQSALIYYGVIKPKDSNQVDIESVAGYLRLDALAGIQELRKHAFSASNDTVKPELAKYSKQILKFWNINSLIRLCPQLDNGITLCLIEEEDITNSYFVFAVKNGGNFSIVTDKQKWAFPGQSSYKRNHRSEFDRMGKHWLPYHLLEINYDEDQKVFRRAKGSNQLVDYQTELQFLGRIADLDAYEGAWIIMMFDLIKERYFHRNTQEALTYTGAMVVSESALIKETKSLPVVLDAAIVMPKLRVKDVLRKSMERTEESWSDLPFYNKWIEDRYAKQVKNNVLVVMGKDDKVKTIAQHTKSGHITATEIQINKIGPFSNKITYQLQSIEPTEFGSREELIKDVRWNARYNLARAMQKLLDVEFAKEEKNIIDWYQHQFKAHMPKLIKRLVSFDDDYFNTTADQPRVFAHRLSTITDVRRRIHTGAYSPFNYHHGFFLSATELDHNNKFEGWGGDAAASLFFLIKVKNALDIPNVTGLKLEDLPVFLRHYRMIGYNGNSILDRLDPVDAHIKSPWDRISLNVLVPISKRSFHSIRKEMNLPKVTDFSEHFRDKRHHTRY